MKETKISDTLITNDDDFDWLVTYADLVTLLLVFFVLLYSISSNIQTRFISALQTIKSQMENNSFFAQHIDMFDFPDYRDQFISLEEVTGLISRQDSLIRDVNRFITQNNDNNDLTTFVRMGKIIIRIDGSYLFEQGSAEINKGFIPVLLRLLDIMRAYPDYILNIKGHTDDEPISSTSKYGSNWELSSARATEVLKYLIKNGVEPERLTATGYGSTIPLVSNSSPENRAKNRRVEFVLEKDVYQ
ncbi:MAG: OmpA family protein [Desulfamplus sp.]|nr:OmpA family protein [Desulfamplus sp.]